MPLFRRKAVAEPDPSPPPPTPPTPPTPETSSTPREPSLVITSPDDLAAFEAWIVDQRDRDDPVGDAARLWDAPNVRWSEPANRKALQAAILTFFTENAG